MFSSNLAASPHGTTSITCTTKLFKYFHSERLFDSIRFELSAGEPEGTLKKRPVEKCAMRGTLHEEEEEQEKE